MTRSPRRTPTENDDLLTEILLRLPPDASSLPRAGLVCKRWRRLVTDPGFVRRFRARHGTLPVLGFFRRTCSFIRTVDGARNRVPASRFWLRRWCGRTRRQSWMVLDCRHGLVLYGYAPKSGFTQFVVANPMTGHQRRVPVPNTERDDSLVAAAAVVAVGDIFRRSFRLVVLFTPRCGERVSVSVYSSDSGTWAHAVATLVLPSRLCLHIHAPSVLSGSAIYWLHGVIIRFDLENLSLAVINQPPVAGDLDHWGMTRQLTTMGDGRLCFAMSSGFNIQLWGREGEEELDNRAAKWVLHKTIQLDKLLPLDLKEHGVKALGIWGFDEECHVIFVCTFDGVFTVHLESMDSKKVYGKPVFDYILPYSSF